MLQFQSHHSAMRLFRLRVINNKIFSLEETSTSREDTINILESMVDIELIKEG